MADTLHSMAESSLKSPHHSLSCREWVCIWTGPAARYPSTTSLPTWRPSCIPSTPCFLSLYTQGSASGSRSMLDMDIGWTVGRGPPQCPCAIWISPMYDAGTRWFWERSYSHSNMSVMHWLFVKGFSNAQLSRLVCYFLQGIPTSGREQHIQGNCDHSIDKRFRALIQQASNPFERIISTLSLVVETNGTLSLINHKWPFMHCNRSYTCDSGSSFFPSLTRSKDCNMCITFVFDFDFTMTCTWQNVGMCVIDDKLYKNTCDSHVWIFSIRGLSKTEIKMGLTIFLFLIGHHIHTQPNGSAGRRLFPCTKYYIQCKDWVTIFWLRR